MKSRLRAFRPAFFLIGFVLCAVLLPGCGGGTGATAWHGTWRVSPTWAASEGARQNKNDPGKGAIAGAATMSRVSLELGDDGVFALDFGGGELLTGSWQTDAPSGNATLVVTALNQKPLNQANGQAPDPSLALTPTPPSVSSGPLAPGETPLPTPEPKPTPTVVRFTCKLDPQDSNRMTLSSDDGGSSNPLSEMVFERVS